MVVFLINGIFTACESLTYLDRQSNSCVRQCPLFFFGNHTTAQCQPCKIIDFTMGSNVLYYFFAVPDMLENGIQADATAYFGSIVTNATIGTPVFPFRIVIDLNAFAGDLSAVLLIMNRNNLVDAIFKFSDGENTRRFMFDNGIVAENALGMLRREFSLIENRFVVFEDFIIYQQAPPPSLELPTTLDFDMSIIAVGIDPSNSQSGRFAVGNVTLIPPPGEYMITICAHYL